MTAAPLICFFALLRFIIQCILIGFCVLHTSLRPAWAAIGLRCSKRHGVSVSDPALAPSCAVRGLLQDVCQDMQCQSIKDD